LEIPDKSPEPTQEQIEGCFRIGADEAINDDDGLDPEEIHERDEKKEASHSAQVMMRRCCGSRCFDEVIISDETIFLTVSMNTTDKRYTAFFSAKQLIQALLL